MLDCFIDYIGLTNCGGAYETSGSGQYINSLPGITLQSVDEIADKEQQTYEGVWTDVQNSAIPRFYNKVVSELNKCFSLNKDCDYDELICDNQEVLVTSWMYMLGAQLMLERLYSPRLNFWTLVTIEDAKQLKDFYQAELDGELALAVKLFNTDSCELCCGGNPEIVTYLP